MPRFAATHSVGAPLERVLAFYRSADALRRLTPPPVAVHVISSEPLGEGSVAEFDIGLPLIPRSLAAVRWRARHSDFSTDAGKDGRLARHAFADRMELGPLKSWRHMHEFTHTESGGTRIADVVDFEHYTGPRSWPARMAFNRGSLACLFAWRALVSRAILAADTAE